LKPILLQPGETRSILNECYLGPKSREAFNEVAAYREQEYVRQIDASYSIGACSFMTFKSLTRFMVWLLNVLQAVVINYGIAIIILVLIVRTLLHPLTKRGQVNMMRMQERMGALAPKMEDLKKRYANDKTKLNQETMKLYQQEGINPATQFLSSCLPMMLQMPIWIALYTSLNFNIDMRHQPFVWWIRDLTAPDAFLQFEARNIPLLSALTGPITSLNLLPVLVSLSMFLQQKLMPKPTPPSGRSSEQGAQAEQMQKMMPYMTLIFGLFFYNMPSGLNLYIMASSTFGALEQWRIRKHIAELKEKGDVLKTASKKKAAPKGGPSFFQRLQKAAEEAQKVKSQHGKKKRKH
ncbi:MAG: membrane protein insertase YidC, partial [Planctomycetes bacterium]|nr:membrane protein insertase YidC [Planctomycetota bacterium]